MNTQAVVKTKELWEHYEIFCHENLMYLSELFENRSVASGHDDVYHLCHAYTSNSIFKVFQIV